MVADQKNSEAYEFIEEIFEKGLDLSYQILFTLGLLGIGWIVDIIKCLLQKSTDSYGLRIMRH